MLKINTEVIKIKCLFVIFPQLFDLRLNLEKPSNFFKDLSNRLNIIDLTENFSNKKDYTNYFINDKYGGHLNSKGNKYVANIIKKNNTIMRETYRSDDNKTYWTKRWEKWFFEKLENKDSIH